MNVNLKPIKQVLRTRQRHNCFQHVHLSNMRSRVILLRVGGDIILEVHTGTLIDCVLSPAATHQGPMRLSVRRQREDCVVGIEMQQCLSVAASLVVCSQKLRQPLLDCFLLIKSAGVVRYSEP